MVELVAALRIAVEERRVARCRDVRVELLPDPLQIVGHLGERVRAPVEPAEDLGAVRLSLVQVVEVEPELLHEAPKLVVTLVDQLAAVLVDLTVGEEPAVAPAAPAEPCRRLVHLRAIAGLLQAIRARQAGEPGAHDDDGRRRRRTSRSAEPSQAGDAEAGDPGLLEQLRARRPRALVLVRDLRDRALDVLHERRASHPVPLFVSRFRVGGPHHARPRRVIQLASGGSSRASRSSTVSRRRMRRPSPPRTSTAAGRGVAL